jgi:hypothetical protein
VAGRASGILTGMYRTSLSKGYFFQKSHPQKKGWPCGVEGLYHFLVKLSIIYLFQKEEALMHLSFHLSLTIARQQDTITLCGKVTESSGDICA